MQSHTKSFASFLKLTDVQFVIPIYQRNYDWGKGNCRQLLNDALKAATPGEGEHFVGSIIYQEVKQEGQDITQHIIIDGQQRLTTVSLLYLAIANAMKAKSPEEYKKIRKRFLVNEDATDEKAKVKLRRHDNSAEALRKLIDGDIPADSPNNSRLLVNYGFFREQISEENAALVAQGLDKLYFVEIKLEREDDAQKIFESMNNTGIALSPGDLIRNYILINLPFGEQKRVYRRYWGPIEVSAQQHNISRVTEFVRHYMTLDSGTIPAFKRVYDDFKTRYPSLPPQEGGKIAAKTEKLLEEMKEYAHFYGKILNPKTETHPEIQKHLINVQKLNVDVCHPLLLHAYKSYTDGLIDVDSMVGMLKLIQSYVIRRSVVGLQTTGNNKTFMSLLINLKKAPGQDYLQQAQNWLAKRRETQRFPDNDEVIVGLQTRNVYSSPHVWALMEQLENHGNTTENITFDGTFTLEHIFPQNPEQGWRKLLSDDEMQKMKARLHTVANLTLSLNNGALGNKTFKEKRDMKSKDGKGQGYKYSKLWLTQDLAELDAWNLHEMDNRLQRLQGRFLAVWPFPTITREDASEKPEGVNFSELSPDDLPEAVSACIFFGEKINAETARDIYVGIVNILFVLDQEKFDSGELADILGITEEPSQTWTHHELPDGRFFVTHANNRAQWNRIRRVLDAVEMPNELQLIYSKDDGE